MEMLIVFEVYEAFSTNALLFFNEISLISYFMRHFPRNLYQQQNSMIIFVKNSDFAFGQMKIEDSKQRDKL